MLTVCVSVQMHADKPKDPNAPKPNKTPFNFFSVDARQKAKESYPDLTQAEITKRVSFNNNNNYGLNPKILTPAKGVLPNNNNNYGLNLKILNPAKGVLPRPHPGRDHQEGALQ